MKCNSIKRILRPAPPNPGCPPNPGWPTNWGRAKAVANRPSKTTAIICELTMNWISTANHKSLGIHFNWNQMMYFVIQEVMEVPWLTLFMVVRWEMRSWFGLEFQRSCVEMRLAAAVFIGPDSTRRFCCCFTTSVNRSSSYQLHAFFYFFENNFQLLLILGRLSARNPFEPVRLHETSWAPSSFPQGFPLSRAKSTSNSIETA